MERFVLRESIEEMKEELPGSSVLAFAQAQARRDNNALLTPDGGAAGGADVRRVALVQATRGAGLRIPRARRGGARQAGGSLRVAPGGGVAALVARLAPGGGLAALVARLALGGGGGRSEEPTASQGAEGAAGAAEDAVENAATFEKAAAAVNGDALGEEERALAAGMHRETFGAEEGDGEEGGSERWPSSEEVQVMDEEEGGGEEGDGEGDDEVSLEVTAVPCAPGAGIADQVSVAPTDKKPRAIMLASVAVLGGDGATYSTRRTRRRRSR